MNHLRRTDRFVSPRMRITLGLVLAASVGLPLLAAEKIDRSNVAATDQRLTDEIRTISSDTMEGRGVGSAGLNLAADYIAKKYADLGLKMDTFQGTPFQKFKISTAAEEGPKEKNHLALVGPPNDKGEPQKIELQLGADYSPLAISGSGVFDLPVVFAGYGITTHKEKGSDKPSYDDYEGLDVKGKAVILLRHTPDQANPHGNFQGGQHPDYAPIVRKVSNAYEHGAAAVLFCTDDFDIEKNMKGPRQHWHEDLDALAKAE
ncbi:MAG TPA: hypothetical protein VFE24_07365, partial [Pirellulales bacterium]|nr:hypothetical protein [Pirellulales bacterium]